jgi:WS/DGAT/MGAT family acyltransferase
LQTRPPVVTLPTVRNPDRLSALDASFLHIEDAGPHMHVGAVLVFDGEAPPHEEALAHMERRLHLVPRYRQKLAFPPLVQGRPVWIDDPHFNAGYHLRHTALPEPAGVTELRRLAGRVFSQRLDRSKPLWELWMVDWLDLGDGRPRHAAISKTHHTLVDGVSGVDLASVLFDLTPDPADADGPVPAWHPRPEPSSAALLSESVVERATGPVEAARALAGAVADPAATLSAAGRALKGVADIARAGFGAPPSPLNTTIGPHRRFTWVTASLDEFKAIKNGLGGTVNDVVLTAVAGALRRWMLADGHEIAGLTLRAMVPMSIRADAERGALGNRVTTMYAPLPVGVADPRERFEIVHEAMRGLKESGQAVGADVLTKLTGFAPPTVLDQAARLQGRQRMFNLTVTNVPGPQRPLYMLGNRLEAMYPKVPLVSNTALGIAIISYDGRLCFGLLADYDALPDVEDVAAALEESIAELAALAGGPAPGRRRRTPARVGRG